MIAAESIAGSVLGIAQIVVNPPPRSRSGSRSNRLFMFLPRFSQVRVEIDEPRRNHQSRGSHQHGSIRSSEIRSNLGDPPIDNQHVKPFIKPGSRINHTPAMDQDAAHEPPRISRKSTAIRTARPAETCASIRLCGPCATSTAISTPSFIGSRMHHDRIRRRQRHTFSSQLISPSKLSRRRQQLAPQTLILNPQSHHRVSTDNRLVEVRLHLHRGQRKRMLAFRRARSQRRRQQRPRRDQRQLSAERRQRPQIRTRYARVQDVADNHDLPTRQVAEFLEQDVRIEQRLRRMRVLTVARIEHVPINRARSQPGCARGVMPHHHSIRADRRERVQRLDQRFALLNRRPRAGDVDHVCAEDLAGQLEG